MSSAASARLRALAWRSTAADRAAMPQNDVAPRASSASCTVSRTVSSGNSVAAWNVRPRPARARWCGGELRHVARRAARPCPWLGTKPPMALSSVDLPAPLVPMSPMTSPGVGAEVDVVDRDEPAEARRVRPAVRSTLPSALVDDRRGSATRVSETGGAVDGLRRRARAAASRASAGSSRGTSSRSA